ncbi:MAG TPA: hypothetical protein VK912_15145 [Longimicrobiales bacterium]|nr:hypothetical protein [Longimicrobiales bacterium]
MRRTTQWAVFTSMNKQQPALRSLYEPAEIMPVAETTADEAEQEALEGTGKSDTALDLRRDRVDFM